MAKKAKQVVSRRSKASRLVEEKNVGIETVDWSSVPMSKYRLTMMETLKHYNYFYDYHETFRWAVDWVKQNRTKTDLKYFKLCPDSKISQSVGRFCRIMSNGGKLTDNDMAFIQKEIDRAISIGKEKNSNTKKDVVDIPKKTPADIVKENTSDFIAEVETHIDNWKEWDLSVFQQLKSVNAPYNMAKGVYDYYVPLRDELNELVTASTPDLEEGYQNVGKRDRKRFLKLVNGILADAEMYMMSKKAVRKPRKKKETTATQQVSKVKYLKESKEFKISSIDPTNIVGASEIYLFNTKYRTLTYLVSSSKMGFEVKGTTIQNMDMENSYKKTIRKPEEFLGTLIKAPKVRSRKLLSELKTKQAEANGRINDQTIIMKGY